MLGVLSVVFLGGCYHEEWTFRAIPNVNVTRPYEPGSQGPLVLVNVPDAAGATKDEGTRTRKMTAQEVARLDATMSRLLSQREEATQRIARLQAAGLGASHPKIMEAQLDLEEINKDINDHMKNVHDTVPVFGGTDAPANSAVVRSQTVLVLSEQKDLGSYDKSVGRSVVLFIEGGPVAGEYWLNADNSVLISYSAYTAPARTRMGLHGSVKIIEVNADRIIADVAIRETTEADSTLWVEKPYDPVHWQIPWVITGRHSFKITTPEDPALKKASVQWGAEKKI